VTASAADAWPRPTTAPVRLDAALEGLVDRLDAPALQVSGITHDSREVRPGDLYCALQGLKVHGADFAAEARAAGAVAILTDDAGAERCAATGAPLAVTREVRAVMGEVAARVHGRPADDLTMLGITGTNGKTTTAFMLAAALEQQGRAVGVIGTLGVRIGTERLPGARTTPEATAVHAMLALMRERGVDAVVMEVSSHALAMGRVDGIVYDVAGFTNLSQDHLDFHGTMEAYFAAKASLFTPRRARKAAICVDDAWGRRLLDETAIPAAAVSVGVDAPFDARNAALAGAMAGLVGADPVAAEAAARTVSVPGRWERPLARGTSFDAIVDYAHTPDAVAGAVAAARAEASGPVVVVLGAGGDRDASKRPLMGAAASLADVVIVTDDNPRSEPAVAIRAAILEGIAGAVPAGERGPLVLDVPDRRAAIERGVAEAAAGDGTLLVLGKGHEQGQEIAGVVHPFDDRDEVRAAAARFGAPS
jgi:UDP-N-acetylmuramoyl-L-alanyl-D-glutamate--2,6-diaminopimelate ligase